MSVQEAIAAYRQGDQQKALQLAQESIQKKQQQEFAWVLVYLFSETPEVQQQALQNASPNIVKDIQQKLAAGKVPADTREWPPKAVEFYLKQVEKALPAAKTPKEDVVGVYEMFWDCEFCGSTKLLGLTHRFCPNCGASQNPAKRYFPSDAEKVAVKDHVYVGADVICPTCQTLSSAKAEFCGNCGTPLTDAARAKLIEGDIRQARDLVKENFDAEMQRIQAKPSSGWLQMFMQKGLYVPLLVLMACAVLCAGAFYAFTRTEETSVEVVGHSWEREIEILTFQTVRDSTWRDSIPSGAYDISSCSRRQSGTNRIPDGQTCETRRVDNGDGTFREVRDCRTNYREEPVYEDYCDYKIDKWVVTDTVSVDGDSFSDAPFWPEVSLNRTGDCLGCQKTGDRDEKYVVKLKDSQTGKTYTCDFDRESDWQKYPMGTKWTLEISKLGGAPHCDTLKRLQG